ncbi:MAG TPA: glycosyltransferase family 4 protein [Sedimentisphaerales bacterium]|nr:glycosyltransferase family 4 protein [Sedimentisphaerales bacterium]
MKVFMLGWEFPPFISGGLGTACYGLTKAMSKLGTEILFVLPRAGQPSQSSHIKILSAEGYIKTEELSDFQNVRFKAIVSPLRPYVPSRIYEASENKGKNNRTYTWHSNPSENTEIYSRDIYEQVCRYAHEAAQIASIEDFDVVHAHDWMTYPAGVEVACLSRKPLVVHVHSTEFDRSGEHVNQTIYDIERRGMHAANKVIAVSNYTKNMITGRYGISPDKVEVVYNAVESNNGASVRELPNKSAKIVLFLGRITMQKGPEYFIAAAKKVLEKVDNVKFVMAGDGDMTHRMIEYAAWLGIGHKVFFTRFLRGDDVDRAYQMADLYVMPSVSEPFGIAPLEALRHGVPVLISKQSGIAETLKNALKVDFWDINQMANKMVAVLKHSPLSRTLREYGNIETGKFRWEDSAAKVNNIYKEMLACTPVRI